MNGQETPSDDNPLLKPFDTPFDVPPFDKIKPEHFMPAFKALIQAQDQTIDAIVNNAEPATFANTVEVLDRSGIKLSTVQTIFGELKATESTPELRKLAEELSPLMARHNDDIRLNDKLFQRIKTLYETKDSLGLNEEQQKLLEKYYKDYARQGANLSPEKKARLKEINGELAVLEEKYGANVLNETNNFQLVIEKKEDLAGLPQSIIDAGAAAAADRNMPGKWVYTLHRPSIFPFLQYSKKRELREKIFKGYMNRGNNNNEFDNKKIAAQILTLDLEKANLLGYKTFDELTIDANMAKTPKAVYDLLDKLWKPALEASKREAKELQQLIDREHGRFKLQPWDWWYYSEKLRVKKYNLDDETMRPYFKLENVRDGAFYVAKRLWGLTFKERTDIPKYNKDVQVFEVLDADGSHLGILYMDFYQRASKQGGAWMSEFRSEYRENGKRIAPVDINVHNFGKPTPELPTLLNADEARTLFHEFGHGLHGLLANTTYPGTGGMGVAIDFVELPSQIMENWAMEPEVMKEYAKNYKTGEPIPQSLIDKIKRSTYFNKGFESLEKYAAAILDMDLHGITSPENVDVEKIESTSMKRIHIIPEIIPRYRATYFTHIFGGGYAAGYYSYIWAEVLEADAFQAFKETGIFNKDTAHAFRVNVLEKGSSADPMALYKRFRGKEPGIEPLLKRNGFINPK
ncbi:MAG: M3 family metallopeptidase [Candidatus Omnitrophota bacterium]